MGNIDLFKTIRLGAESVPPKSYGLRMRFVMQEEKRNQGTL